MTAPDGLFNTTTAFAIPDLFISTTRPEILIIERSRDAAARAESSEDPEVDASGDEVAGLLRGDSVGAAGDDSGGVDGVLVGVTVVSLGLLLTRLVSEEDEVDAFSVG